MSLKIVLFLLSIFTLSSCASMQQAWVAQNCTREAAYEKGMNDARSGAEMNSQYYAGCPIETQQLVSIGYHDGYNSGLASMQQPTAVGAPALINVNIGAEGTYQNPRAWFCKAHAFTDDFEAFGATQIEAGQRVHNQCTAKYDKMFCEARCRLNQ